MGVVAFWVALAAVLIAGSWAKTRSEALKHGTLRKPARVARRISRSLTMDSGDAPRDDEERGDDLCALFERERTHVAEQPFVDDVVRRIALARRRRTIATRAAHALAVGALLAASPWLVSGSALLSAKLDALFSSVATMLDSPLGYGAGLVLLIAALVWRRRRLD